MVDVLGTRSIVIQWEQELSLGAQKDFISSSYFLGIVLDTLP